VFRVWQSELTLDYEFRCFVSNDRITAITQYDHYAVYPHLEPQRASIQRLIEQKWSEVHGHILQRDYVVDFGFLPQRNEVVLIEISPLRRCTGAGCFHWTLDHDLLFGVDPDKPIEFRLQQTLHPQIDDLVDANWECRWWNDHEPDPLPYWTWFDRVDPDWNSKMVLHSPSKRRAIPWRFGCVVTAALVAVDAVLWTVDWEWALGVLGVIAIWSLVVLVATLSANRERAMVITDELKPLQFMANRGHCDHIEQIAESEHDAHCRLFVYGTLKRGFHWNQKYLSRGAQFECNGRTKQKFPLVMGECNVPYVLDLDGDGAVDSEQKRQDIGHCINGELWIADYETMIGLDEYEGVHKGHYKRKLIEVVTEHSSTTVKAHIYMKADVDNIDLSNAECLSEYDLEYHKEHYSPIRHIQVKQLKYLGEDFTRS